MGKAKRNFKNVIQESVKLATGKSIEGIYKGLQHIERKRKVLGVFKKDDSYYYLLLETHSNNIERIPLNNSLRFAVNRGDIQEGDYLKITRDQDSTFKGRTRKNYIVEKAID